MQTRKEIESSCPEGYMVAIPGQTIDMLGAEELWIIHEKNPEPQRYRVPQDYVDYGDGKVLARRPKEWGHPVYYKVV
jgi:hypothetical protein